MTNPHVTKLRIKQEQLKRIHDKADQEAMRARRAWEEAWLEYVRAMRDIGVCAACQRPLAECQCVASAAEPSEEYEQIGVLRPDGEFTTAEGVEGSPVYLRRAARTAEPACEHDWKLKSGWLDGTGQHYTDQCIKCQATRERHIGPE